MSRGRGPSVRYGITRTHAHWAQTHTHLNKRKAVIHACALKPSTQACARTRVQAQHVMCAWARTQAAAQTYILAREIASTLLQHGLQYSGHGLVGQ